MRAITNLWLQDSASRDRQHRLLGRRVRFAGAFHTMWVMCDIAASGPALCNRGCRGHAARRRAQRARTHAAAPARACVGPVGTHARARLAAAACGGTVQQGCARMRRGAGREERTAQGSAALLAVAPAALCGRPGPLDMHACTYACRGRQLGGGSPRRSPLAQGARAMRLLTAQGGMCARGRSAVRRRGVREPAARVPTRGAHRSGPARGGGLWRPGGARGRCASRSWEGACVARGLASKGICGCVRAVPLGWPEGGSSQAQRGGGLLKPSPAGRVCKQGSYVWGLRGVAMAARAPQGGWHGTGPSGRLGKGGSGRAGHASNLVAGDARP